MVEVSNRADLIERKIDRALADDITISRETGGVDIRKLGEVMEAAKLMALSGSMVPAFLRENPGGCFAILWRAYAWGMDPFAVASMAYEVKNKRTQETTVAFMSQLIHAIIEARAPIKERLAVRYEGEGDERVCIVSGTFVGEKEPREHRSPRLGDRKPKARGRDSRDPRDEDGINEAADDRAAGSPLWRTKPDVQLWYDTSRDWARIYCPDVLLGIYSREEMQEVGFEPPAPPAPPPPDDGGLGMRLSSSALARAGFPAAQAAATVDAAMVERDNGGRGIPESLSVDPAAEAAPEERPAAPGGPEAGNGSGTPEDATPGSPPPENENAAPRASKARQRRSGRPEDARLV